MQFVVTGRDGADADARDRRLRTRDRHLAALAPRVKTGFVKFGATLLDSGGQVIGSLLVCNCESREALDAWLREEPYVVEGVWATVTIEPCAIAPMFL